MADKRAPAPGVNAIPQSRRHAAAKRRIAGLRLRLLDLTNANRLLNYKFSDRSRRQVRFVHEAPDDVLRHIQDGKRLAFHSLPEPTDEPSDERDDAFLMALEQAKRAEEEYLSQLVGLEEDQHGEEARRVERALRDRVRKALGMPARVVRDQVSRAEWARRHHIEPSFDLPSPDRSDDASVAYTDACIQTLQFPTEMERLLSAIYDQTRTTLQETGANTLYLALGYLQWRERADTQTAMLAPLLLHPIDIERKIVAGAYRYSVGSLGDETEINITLSERLHKDFHRRLPELDAGDTVESYLERVAQAIDGLSGWMIRRFGVVGHFAFARLVMFHDLEDDLWDAEQGVLCKRVVSRLFSGQATASDVFFAEEYLVDDPQVAAKVPLLITDADSSQFSAIVDVMEGKNLAIKGPPGTGKSQTITNIIAATLAAGRSVLFVAEKMAALNIVKERLERAGLGQFCLELHSTKARKKALLASLQERLEIQGRLPEARGVSVALKELERVRDQLSEYVGLVNRPFGASGKTIHEIMWADQLVRRQHQNLPSGLDGIDLRGAKEMTLYDIAALNDRLSAAAAAHADASESCEDLAKHPWRGICNLDLDHFGRGELVLKMSAFSDALRVLEDAIRRVGDELGIHIASRVDHAIAWAHAFHRVPAPEPGLDGHLFAQLREPSRLVALLELEARLADRRTANEALASFVVDPNATTAGRSRLDLLAHIVHDLDLEGQPLAHLGDEARLLASRRVRAERALLFGRRLADGFGVTGPLTATSLALLLAAAKHAASLPTDLRAMRHSGIFHDAAAAILVDGHARVLTLKAKHDALSGRLSIPLDGNAAEWRAHAAVLRSSTFPSALWRRDVREAKRCYRRFLRSPAKRGRFEIASDFEAMSDCVALCASVTEDDDLRMVCGPHFRGHRTPLPQLLAVNAFGNAVRSTLPPDGGLRSELRRTLLEGSSDALAAISLLAEDPDLAMATELLASITDKDSDLVEQCEALGLRAKGMTTLAQGAADLGFKAHIRAEAVPRVRDLVEDRLVAEAAIEANERARELMGAQWQGAACDPAVVSKATAAASAVESAQLPQPLRDHLYHADLSGRIDRLNALRSLLDEAIAGAMGLWDELRQFAKIDDVAFGVSLPACDVAAAAKRIESALEAPAELPVWTNWLRARHNCAEAGLTPILDAFNGETLDGHRMSGALSRVFWRTVARAAIKEHPVLDQFRGLDLQRARDRFRRLDEDVILLQRQALAGILCRRTIEPGHRGDLRKEDTGLVLVRHEAGKQKRHVPIRELLDRAGLSIRQMKPCFMMSPLSVAQFLKPNGLEFDLVIVDEASQMRPEEALGAVARGGQLVVVGDPMQLPPSSFFDRVDRDVQDDDGMEEDVVDNESVLDLALAEFRPARSLRWHYRSRHESLIAFSNREFYDDELIVFPSPLDPERDRREPRLGVYHDFVAGTYRGRVNVQEARVVAEAAVTHMATHPERSLGIVTLNQPQRDILLEEIERLVARERSAQRYIESWERTLESFFVKNLENVQGDERDVIFISTVYGPDETTNVVMNRFGPINGLYGHRRLNVLFTRAKQMIRVFTSMRADDIKASEASQPGLRALKRYLEYAETGRLEPGVETGRGPDSAFEQLVRDRLRERGLEVVSQLGVAGYFIDLAVKHPRRSGYLLGIECDGASYHSSRSARDRDRLRQKVLEGLRWTIYRIWSTDWFRNSDTEARRLFRYIDTLLDRESVPTSAAPEALRAHRGGASAEQATPARCPPEEHISDHVRHDDGIPEPRSERQHGVAGLDLRARIRAGDLPEARRALLMLQLERRIPAEERNCPNCSKRLDLQVTSEGPALRCAARDCTGKRRIQPSLVYAAVNDACIPCSCGGTLVLRGRSSGFLGCTNYPRCRSPLAWGDV